MRDLAATTDGFLILAGPNGDQDWSFDLYHWDGRDMVTWPDMLKAKQIKTHGMPDDAVYGELERHAVAIHEASHAVAHPVATLAGDVFRGPQVVSGGIPQEMRGILETKREIRELSARVAQEQEELSRLAEETAGFEAMIAQASNAIAALNASKSRSPGWLKVIGMLVNEMPCRCRMFASSATASGTVSGAR